MIGDLESLWFKYLILNAEYNLCFMMLLFQCETLERYAKYNLYRKTKKEKKEQNQKGKNVKKTRVSKPHNFKFTMFVVVDYCVFNRGLTVALRSEDLNLFYLMVSIVVWHAA